MNLWNLRFIEHPTKAWKGELNKWNSEEELWPTNVKNLQIVIIIIIITESKKIKSTWTLPEN